MHRFFMAGASVKNGVILLGGSDAKHIKVLRMQLGDKLTICDGEGTDLFCRLSRSGDDFWEATVEESSPCPAEATVPCRIFAGIPKGERADYLIQKCTEAGAQSITFFKSSRCVAVPDGRSLQHKLARWGKIAEEAAKQSGRGIVPEVSYCGDLAAMFSGASKSGLTLFMYETGDRTDIRSALEGADDISSVSIITGPEGGFEPYEAQLATHVGAQLCSMGPRILRCETAPVVALSAVMYHTRNL